MLPGGDFKPLSLVRAGSGFFFTFYECFEIIIPFRYSGIFTHVNVDDQCQTLLAFIQVLHHVVRDRG